MQDSRETLQEKFALTRELERLRPEMEHLKSQLSNHQAVVAEKLDLQRQLNTVEVELENEKRSKEKQRSKQKADGEASGEWKSKLEAAEKKHLSEMKEWEKLTERKLVSEKKDWEKVAEKRLASEKKEWEKATKGNDRELERELREVQGENERLEERLSTMKLKLKNTQNELKEAQAELEKSQSDLAATKKASKTTKAKAKKVTVQEAPARKRRANELSLDDTAIGTPGPKEPAKRPLKKRGAELALVGEKSTFSITPFLNRTKNLSDDSMEETSPTGKVTELTRSIPPIEEEEEDEESLPVVPEAPVFKMPAKPAKAAANPKKPRAKKANALNDAPNLKKNMPAPSAETTEVLQFPSKLDIVTEEAEGVEQENTPVVKRKKTTELKSKAVEARLTSNTSILDADAKKKKRKLLGGATKTIFDDEDGEVAPKPAKLHLTATKRLKANLGGASNAFAGKTFSPLKRDRRGVNASFLA